MIVFFQYYIKQTNKNNVKKANKYIEERMMEDKLKLSIYFIIINYIKINEISQFYLNNLIHQISFEN